MWCRHRASDVLEGGLTKEIPSESHVAAYAFPQVVMMVMGGAGSPRQGALLLLHRRLLLRPHQGQRALWMAFDAYSQGLLFCDPSDNVNLPRNACSSRLGLTAVIVLRGGSVGVHVNESTMLVLAVRVTLCASSKLRSHHACDLNIIMSSRTNCVVASH